MGSSGFLYARTVLNASPICRTSEGIAVSCHSKVKVPIKVEIVVEVMPHKRLVGELLVHKFIKKGDNLRAIHWLVKVWRHRCEVNPFTKIIGTAFLKTLQKDGHTVFRGRTPVAGNKAPKVKR